MKKFAIALSLISALFAGNIKDNQWFVNGNIGSLKVHDSESVMGLKAGYYFYDPNIYQINNRISVDFEKVNSNADFYITSLKLDWLKNDDSTNLVPFAGVNLGYISFTEHERDFSAGMWGAQLGILYEINYNMSVELEGCYQKAYEKTNVWNSALKTLKVGLEYSF